MRTHSVRMAVDDGCAGAFSLLGFVGDAAHAICCGFGRTAVMGCMAGSGDQAGLDGLGALGVDPLYTALPSYVVIMGGGALVNLGFCFIRLAKVKNLSIKADFSLAKPLIISNILLSALGGLMWYLQFFFYAWGHASIPAQYDYMSWMLHMSFYVLCGGLVGLILKEWNNAGRRPVGVLSLGCVVIIIAANIVGLGMAN